MQIWSTLLGLTFAPIRLTRFGIEISRSALTFGERAAPWPVSMVPRAMRVPLDVAADIVGAMDGATGVPHAASGDPTATEPARSAVVDPPRRERERPAPRHRATEPRTESARPAGGSSHAAGHGGAEAATPPDEAHTATIAGARSDGPDDTPRYDRNFRARQAPLYVRDAGSGPAIVLLHAFPLSSRMWEPQLRSLSSRFRIVAPDLAGFGLSWTAAASLSLEDQAQAIELTLDDLGIDELVLVGASMGGYVALPLVERLGARVRGLVLANTRATADDERTVEERHRLAAEIETDGVDVAAEELLPKLLGAATTRDVPELVDHVHALVLENKEPGVIGALRAMAARRDATAILPSIACPTLVIAGEEDTLVPVDAARALAAAIHDAQLAVLRCGHLPNLEASAEFDRVLSTFARRAHDAPRKMARTRRAHA